MLSTNACASCKENEAALAASGLAILHAHLPIVQVKYSTFAVVLQLQILVCWYREEPAISPRVLAQWPRTGFGPVDSLPSSPLKATQAYQSGKIPKWLGMQVGHTPLLTRGALCIAVHRLTGQACSASC